MPDGDLLHRLVEGGGVHDGVDPREGEEVGDLGDRQFLVHRDRGEARRDDRQIGGEPAGGSLADHRDPHLVLRFAGESLRQAEGEAPDLVGEVRVGDLVPFALFLPDKHGAGVVVGEDVEIFPDVGAGGVDVFVFLVVSDFIGFFHDSAFV